MHEDTEKHVQMTVDVVRDRHNRVMQIHGALQDVTANRDAAMYDLYRDLLSTWETGGGLFMHYSLVRRPSWMWGSFGALEWVDQPLNQAHKYRALLDYIEGR